MNKNEFEGKISDFVRTDAGNFVAGEIALRPELAGMQIFEAPIFGYADSADPLFAELRAPGIIGDHFVLPGEWLGGARTVIAMFFPFADVVKKANGADMGWPADEWLHARIEGQEFQLKICRHAVALLAGEGFAALAPMTDPRFSGKHPHIQDRGRQDFYTSNWSERHVAFVCGLGTFSLSRGLITAKGVAGRFVSFVTDAPFEPNKRPYAKFDEWCARCGACVRNCPARAISLEGGKSHPLCSAFLDRVTERCGPRYGCGKCQVRVPCENGVPGAGNRK